MELESGTWVVGTTDVDKPDTDTYENIIVSESDVEYHLIDEYITQMEMDTLVFKPIETSSEINIRTGIQSDWLDDDVDERTLQILETYIKLIDDNQDRFKDIVEVMDMWFNETTDDEFEKSLLNVSSLRLMKALRMRTPKFRFLRKSGRRMKMKAARPSPRADMAENVLDYLDFYADPIHDFGDVKRMGVDDLSNQSGVVSVVDKLCSNYKKDAEKYFKPKDALKCFMRIREFVEKDSTAIGFWYKATEKDPIKAELGKHIVSRDQVLRDAGGSVILKRNGYSVMKSVPFERAFDAAGKVSFDRPRKIGYDNVFRMDRLGYRGLHENIGVDVEVGGENISIQIGQEPSRNEVSEGDKIKIRLDGNRYIGDRDTSASVPNIAKEISKFISIKSTNLKRWSVKDMQYIWSLLALKRSGDQGQAEYVRVSNQDPSSLQGALFFETSDYLAACYALLKDVNLITKYMEKVPYLYLRNLSKKLSNGVAFKILQTEVSKFDDWMERRTRDALSDSIEVWFRNIQSRTRALQRSRPNSFDKVGLISEISRLISTARNLVDTLGKYNLKENLKTYIMEINRIVTRDMRFVAKMMHMASYTKIFLHQHVDANTYSNHVYKFSSLLDTISSSIIPLYEEGFPIKQILVEMIPDDIDYENLKKFISDIQKGSNLIGKIFVHISKVLRNLKDNDFHIFFNSALDSISQMLEVKFSA